MTSIVSDADAFTTELSSHLESYYKIQVKALVRLEVGVFRIDRAGNSSWIARIFPGKVPKQSPTGLKLARFLQFLQQCDFPSERCAHEKPVSVFRGQEVLVTENLDGHRPKICEETFYKLGDILGRLHKIRSEKDVIDWRGGAWHHLAEGGPEDEIAAALASVLEAKSTSNTKEQAAYAELQAELQQANHFTNLPCALVHPDFVPSNIIELRDHTLIPIDWTGSGHGPRIFSLGWSIFAAGLNGTEMIESLIEGYRPHISMDAKELSNLPNSIFTRQLSLACWEARHRGRRVEEIAQKLPTMHKLARKFAQVATLAFAKEEPQITTSNQREVTVTSQTELQVGSTGLFTAAIRAEESKRSNRLFNDPLAESFVSYSKYVLPSGQRVEALRKFIVARTVFFDELILSACQGGCRQVVLVGAGMDSRAFRLPLNPDTCLFELDTLDILDNKSKVLEDWPGSLQCSRFTVPCDLRSNWSSELIAIGFDAKKSTAWIIEGVFMYLREDTVNEVVSAISRLSTSGSILGLDMASHDQSGSVPRRLRRSTAPFDPVLWLADHGWEARLSYTRDVLRTHGRLLKAMNGGRSEDSTKPKAILVEATFRL